MDYVFSGVIGFLTSLIASIAFLFFILYNLRPKIGISHYIVKGTDLDSGATAYFFKFVNYSKFQAFDVRIRLSELIRMPTDGGKINTRRKDLTLKKAFIAHVPAFIPTANITTYAPHAIQFTCLDDLQPILKDKHRSVEVQIILKHGLTGLAQVFDYEYSEIDNVKTKEWPFGNELTIS